MTTRFVCFSLIQNHQHPLKNRNQVKASQMRSKLKLVILICAIIIVVTLYPRYEQFVENIPIHKGLSIPPPSPTWQFDIVPNIIHQTAPNDVSKWPDKWIKCQESWKDHFPEWSYTLWDDDGMALHGDSLPVILSYV